MKTRITQWLPRPAWDMMEKDAVYFEAEEWVYRARCVAVPAGIGKRYYDYTLSRARYDGRGDSAQDMPWEYLFAYSSQHAPNGYEAFCQAFDMVETAVETRRKVTKAMGNHSERR